MKQTSQKFFLYCKDDKENITLCSSRRFANEALGLLPANFREQYGIGWKLVFRYFLAPCTKPKFHIIFVWPHDNSCKEVTDEQMSNPSSHAHQRHQRN